MVLRYVTVQVHCCSSSSSSSRVGLQSPCSRPAVGCLAAEGGKFGLGEGPQSISLCLTVCPSDWYLHEKGCCAFPPWSVLTPSSPLCGKLIPTHAVSQTVNAKSRYVLNFSNQGGVVVLEKLILQVNLPSAPALLPPFHIMTVRNPLYLQGRALKSIYTVFALNIYCVCTEYKCMPYLH